MITEILVESCIRNGAIEYTGFVVLEKETTPVDFSASFAHKGREATGSASAFLING
jgi:hypothetical protein